VGAPRRLRIVESVVVSALRGEVEELVDPHQLLHPAVVGRVSVVDDAILKREGAHALALRRYPVDGTTWSSSTATR